MNIKKTHVSIGLLIFILSLAVVGTVNQSFNPQSKLEIPKTSAGEITIVTPENKTYTEPMSGYYPGTYGFENDEDGITPQGWIDNSQAGCSGIIISDKLGHEKVLHIDDDSGNKVYFDNDFSNQSYGTIEMWVLAEDCMTGFKVRLVEATSLEQTIRVGIANNKWVFYNGSASDLLFTMLDGVNDPIDNTWYHLKIHFRCNGAPAYQGLNQNNVKIVVDGYASEEVMVWNNKDNVNRLTFTTGAAPSTDGWVDAIAYSWNPYYSIGDNLNEGLLLGYDNITNLDWQGYSLDGLSNKTVLGNTTIPIPSDGSHNIQVFGNDSFNTMYESDVRYFTVNTTPYIDIITPENKTYTEPDSGYYPATYGFENDQDGSDPFGWSVLETGGTVDVISSLGGHSKIVEINGITSYPRMQHNFSTSHESGTVEFWMRGNDVTKSCLTYIGIDMAGGTLITIGIDNDQFLYYAPGAIPQNIVPCNDNTWYHVRVDFECGSGAYQGLSADHFYIYINGQRYGEYGFRIAGNDVEYMRNVVWDFSVVYYFDAIGYSWDPNYNIGDNLKEGLLLGYNTNTDFNWTAYSLDGQANQTILGNKTIPMPSDGLHSIQVFGNDSMGTVYESDMRYFTTNALGPEITINSPISNQLYGTTPPDFSISISVSDLDARWHSLNGGTTNIPFSGLSGTIDQTEWDKMGNGTATITFYANDTANNIGQAGVTVRKDIIAPVITIISPTTAEEFDYTPIFDITIAEANLDDFWYTIDNGANNYTISSPTGTINQTAWDTASDGPVTIRFYARDDVGNIGTNSVIVAKIPSDIPTPTPTPPPGIPGYNIIALIGVTLAVTLILAKRKHKK